MSQIGRHWHFSSRKRRRPVSQVKSLIRHCDTDHSDSERELEQEPTAIMRSTRTKTGTLPAKVVPFGEPVLEDEVVDAAIAKLEEPEVSDNVKDSKAIITTFKSDNLITNGTYIIRSLANGCYELVNIQHFLRETMGSVEFGKILKEDPGRFTLVESVKETMSGIQENVIQAVHSAKGEIFRFLKLPRDLRFMIYDLAIKSSYVLDYNAGEKPESGLALRSVNKLIHAESAGFFWSNNFDFSYAPNPKDDEMVHTFALVSANVREVTFTWMAEKIKNKLAIEFLEKCPNLKVFNLLLTRFSIVDPVDINLTLPPLLWTGQCIPKFVRVKGVDSIARLRGLKKVTVKKLETGSLSHHNGVLPDQITQAEIDEFEKFLNERMTQPVRSAPSSRKSKSRRHLKGKRKSSGYRDADEDDSDYEGFGGAKRSAKTKRRITIDLT